MTTPSTPSDGGSITPRIGGLHGQQQRTANNGKPVPPTPMMDAPTATPVGGRAFASPAMLRILLTPATSDVTPEEFERMTSAIRRIESIRISDLPKSAQRGESIAPASALAKAGEVHITFITSYDPSHAFLSPFNVHRQVLGVLGLAMCSSAQSMEKLERAPAALRQLHPHAVVHRVFGFDTGAMRPQNSGADESIDMAESLSGDASVDVEGGDMGEGTLTRTAESTAADSTSNTKQPTERPTSSSSSSSRDSTSGFSNRRHDSALVIFPAVRRDLKDVRFYLKTLVPNFIGDVLDGLDMLVKGLQGKPLETPRETLDSVTSTSMAVSSAKTLGANVGAAASSAASRASALFSSFSSDETSRKASKSGKNTQSVLSTGPTGSGRYAKLKADYYLLVGDLWNALYTYDQCMSLLGKERALAGGQDAVWYASALEGWAVARTLTARMGGQVEEKASSKGLPLGGVKEKDKEKMMNDFQYAGNRWSDIAEAYSLALTIYSKCLAPASYLLDTMRSVNPDTPRDYTHPLIHASACLAYSRFLLAIWASGGWNGETFDQLLLGGVPPALAETTRPTVAVYTQHATASGIQRHDVAAPASQSLTNSSTNALKMLDQIHLYASLSAIFGCLGFARKEAYTIQRLQALVVVLIAQGIHLQKQLGTSSSQALQAGDAAHGTILTQISSVGGGHGSDSILVLALQICQTYGINVQLMPLLHMDRGHILLRASVDAKSGKRISTPMLNRNRMSWGTDLSSPASHWQQFSQEETHTRVTAITELLDEAPFGWTEQQIIMLKDTITICEMLQDRTALLFFASIMLRDFWTHLGFEEQFKLKDGITKTMAEMERGTEKETILQYWGPKEILSGIELEASNVFGSTSKIEFSELSRQRDSDLFAKRSGGFRSSKTPTEDVLMQDEVASFAVSLYNPLQIPLELESIRLELSSVGTLGPSFESLERKAVILPPSSIHVVRLSGTPRGEGRLCVRGVHIKLPFCAERMFTYEYSRGIAAEKTMWKAQSDLDDRWTRTKRFGLEARGSGSTGQGLQATLMPPSRARSRMQESLWLLPVIAKVPEVDIRPSLTLRSGSVVLCDGEQGKISITMTNRSALPVDFVRFSFEDDVQRDIVAMLAEGNLDASDVYELENDLLNRPFLSLDDDNGGDRGEPEAETVIEAGQSKTFVFTMRAKLDVRQAAVNVQYGNKAESRQFGRESFWVYQVRFPFDVRVLPTVFIDSLEVARVEGLAKTDTIDQGKHEHGVVLVSLAAHNAHPVEVEVHLHLSSSLVLKRNQKGEERTEEEDGKGYKITRRLAPHASVRLHLYLPRLAPIGKEEALYGPIPKLVERQFIVDRIKRSKEEERKMRERFWLRQAFLDSIRQASWTEVHSKRTGTIGTAGLHFDADEAVRTVYGDSVRIDVRLTNGEAEHLQEEEKDAWKARANEFVEVRATIVNTSDEPIQAGYALTSEHDERGAGPGLAPEHGGGQEQHEKVLCVGGHMRGHLWPDARSSDHVTAGQTLIMPGKQGSVIVALCFATGGRFALTLFVLSEADTDAQQRVRRKDQKAILGQKRIKVHVH